MEPGHHDIRGSGYQVYILHGNKFTTPEKRFIGIRYSVSQPVYLVCLVSLVFLVSLVYLVCSSVLNFEFAVSSAPLFGGLEFGVWNLEFVCGLSIRHKT